MHYTPHDHMVLIDVETTGIDHEKDLLLEVSAIVVNRHLKEIASLDSFVVHHPREQVDGRIDANDAEIGKPVVRNMHEATGLLDRVQSSGNTMRHLEVSLNSFLDRHFGEGSDRIIVIGNSVRFDLDFLRVNLPSVHQRLNKRIVDVSGIFEVVNFLQPELLGEFIPKPGDHNSLNDLRACLNQLSYIKLVLGDAWWTQSAKFDPTPGEKRERPDQGEPTGSA